MMSYSRWGQGSQMLNWIISGLIAHGLQVCSGWSQCLRPAPGEDTEGRGKDSTKTEGQTGILTLSETRAKTSLCYNTNLHLTSTHFICPVCVKYCWSVKCCEIILNPTTDT
ncbi:hypothetical protein NQD34_018196 [Periophthalmus magnuspinnatus]|nr:hypothetical protein NQD34_018196 [Periophthalmus magnuspinnatus]